MTTAAKNTAIPTTSLVITSNIDKANKILARLAADEITENRAHQDLEKLAKTTFVDIAEATEFFTPKTETPQNLPIVAQKDIQTDAKDETLKSQNTDGSDANEEKEQTDDEKAILAVKRENCLGQIKIAETTQELCEVARKFSPLYAENRQTLDKAKGILDLFRELFALGFTEKDCQKLQIIGTKGNKEILSKQSVYDTFQIASGQRIRTQSAGEGSEKKPKKDVTPLIKDSNFYKSQIKSKFDTIERLLNEMQNDKIVYQYHLKIEKEAAKEAAKNTLSQKIQAMKDLGFTPEELRAMFGL